MLKYSLLAGSALALMLTAAPASAQGYNDDQSYANGPNESVEVIAPKYNYESRPLNGPLGTLKLSQNVSYSDLDLRTRSGARELRMRIRHTAQDICTQLAEQYPVKQQPGTSCYKTALEDGLRKADIAIRDARDYRNYASYRY